MRSRAVSLPLACCASMRFVAAAEPRGLAHLLELSNDFVHACSPLWSIVLCLGPRLRGAARLRLPGDACGLAILGRSVSLIGNPPEGAVRTADAAAYRGATNAARRLLRTAAAVSRPRPGESSAPARAAARQPSRASAFRQRRRPPCPAAGRATSGWRRKSRTQAAHRSDATSRPGPGAATCDELAARLHRAAAALHLAPERVDTVPDQRARTRAPVAASSARMAAGSQACFSSALAPVRRAAGRGRSCCTTMMSASSTMPFFSACTRRRHSAAAAARTRRSLRDLGLATGPRRRSRR